MWWPSKKGRGVIAAVTKVRTDVLERVREINGLTEREVMAAAASTNRIVKAATGHISRLRTLLTALGDAHAPGQPVAAAIEERHRPIAARIQHQCEKAAEAATQCSGIEAAAREVQGLTLKAKLIALNANVQAARANGSEERGFGPIAREMLALSEEIALANERVGALAKGLAGILPGLSAEAGSIRSAAEQFSQDLTERVGAAEAEAQRLRTDVGRLIQESDEVLAHVIEASNESLSHLQFQDIVAQSLLRVDTWLRDTQLTASRQLGLGADEHTFAEVAHVEIGGEKDVDQANAGDVVLF